MSDTARTEDDRIIVRYLLGDLADSQAAGIEERYFLDGDFFEYVGVVEDQLIESFLNQELPPRELELFECKYLVVPELREKVTFARSLRAAVADLRAPARRPAAAKDSGRQGISGSRKGWRFWLSVAAPAFAAAGFIFLVVAWRVSRPNPSPSGRKSAHDEAARSGPPGALTETAAVPGQVLLAALEPGLAKGGASLPQRLVLASGLKEIRLELDLPGVREESLTVRVEFWRVENEQLRLAASREGVTTVPTLDGRTVLLSVAPADLPPGDYVVRVRTDWHTSRRRAPGVIRARASCGRGSNCYFWCFWLPNISTGLPVTVLAVSRISL